MSVETMNRCLVSKVDHIAVYDINTYKEMKDEEIKVNLLPSTTREANRIICSLTELVKPKYYYVEIILEEIHVDLPIR